MSLVDNVSVSSTELPGDSVLVTVSLGRIPVETSSLTRDIELIREDDEDSMLLVGMMDGSSELGSSVADGSVVEEGVKRRVWQRAPLAQTGQRHEYASMPSRQVPPLRQRGAGTQSSRLV